jgi:hypothetical protein
VSSQFASAIPGPVSGLVKPPGTPNGPGGSGGVPPASPGAGWEIFVLSYADYATVLCQIPATVLISFQFNKQLDDLSSGTVVMSMDASWWDTTTLADGSSAQEILDFECVWQFRHDGVTRFEFLGETVSEQLVDQSEQRQVTVTGPGTMAMLKWGMCAPHGFPNIILKLDGIVDSFDEIDVNGNGVLDTNIWNAVSPPGSVFITAVLGTFNYPGGAGYSLSSLYPSGTVTLNATSGGTILGATPYDATDTLISAQVSPIGLNNSTGSYSTSALNGSEVTQFYIQSNANSAYYALIGLTGSAFYCKAGGPDGTKVKTLAAYNPAQHAYWMITEQGGTGGGHGTFYFWTSPDGQNWTLQWQVVHEWDARNVLFAVSATYSVAGSQSAVVSNLNSTVTTPSYQGEAYYGAPIMGIWYDQFSKAQARGTIPQITTTMGPQADSFGHAWTDSQYVQTVNGTDLYTFLQGCASTLNADYVMQPGFVLQVGVPTTNGISIGVQRQRQIVFRDGRNATARARTRARNQIANLIGAENQDGHEISATNNTSINSWAQREGWFQAGAQVDPASLTLAAAAAASDAADEIETQSLSIAPWLPGLSVFDNFDVGDWVGVERPDFSAIDADRVMGIAVSVDQDGNEQHELTLLTYVQWLEQQLTFVANQLGGNFVNAPGLTPVAKSRYGTGQLPTYFTPAQTLDTIANVSTSSSPKATGTALVYNAAIGQYQPAGTTDPVSGNEVPVAVTSSSGTVTVGSTSVAVTNQTGAVAPDGGGPQPAASGITTTSTSHVVVVNGITRVTVGVQADGTVTTLDTNGPAPSAPDAPTVTGIPLGVSVSWDGKLAGAAPLSDFAYTEVHLSPTSGFTPSSSTLYHTFVASGTFTISGLTPGTTYYSVLVAVNTSGAASTLSTQASAAAGYVTGSVVTALTASEIGYLGVLNPNPYFWGGDATGWTGGTLVSGGILPAGSPYTYALTGTAPTIAESGQPFPVTASTMTASNQLLVTAWVYSASTTVHLGFEWFNNGAAATPSSTTSPVTVTANTWTPVSAVITVPVATLNQAAPVVFTSSGALYVEAVTCLPQVPGGLIQAGTIQAAQIAAGTVFAGIVNGTTINAATFTGGVFDGTDFVMNASGAFFYSGSPAAGTLSISIVPGTANVLDPQGNLALPSFTSYQEISGTYYATQFTGNVLQNWTASSYAGPWALLSSQINLIAPGGDMVITSNPGQSIDLNSGLSVLNGGGATFNAAAVFNFLVTVASVGIHMTDGSAPATPTAGAAVYSSSGHLKYKDESGAAYDTGRITSNAAGQTVSATGFTALTGLSVALGVGKYRFRALVELSATSSAGQWQTELLFSGTATVSYGFRFMSGAGVAALNVNQTAFGTSLNGPATSVAGPYWAEYHGTVTVTVAGNLSLSGATSVAADTWTVYSSSSIEALNIT